MDTKFVDGFRPWALDIYTEADTAFELSDDLGMDSHMSALSVTLFDAPNGQMLVQALYESEALAIASRSALSIPSSAEVKISRLPATDWVSETQAGLAPVRAGRFHIHGSHDIETVPNDVIPIHVDAGLAFGTGHHGTTAGCLRIYSELLDQGIRPKTVLDLGCGAGVLAIAAAKTLDTAEILATDIDPDAIMVTDQNKVLNHVQDKVAAHVVDGFDSPQLSGRQFELIFANILAGPLMTLADDIVSATTPSGRVILSGILDEKAQQVAKCFTAAGLNVVPQPSLEGWTSLLAQKPAS